ncbi:MAG: hypothetical protein LBE85_08700 [Candidatus Accumulibacter sp.]|nr:hypothetical protein [Accumulibacter sp.]
MNEQRGLSHNGLASFAVSVICSLILLSCGGGGGDSSEPPVTPEPPVAPEEKAEGAYEGTSSTGYYFNTLVLENDEFYTLYGIQSGDVFGVLGFVHGNGSSSNGVLTAPNVKDFSWDDYSGVSGSLTAAFTPNVSFNGTLVEGATTITLSGTAIDNSIYAYDTAATLSHLTGAWYLTGLQGDELTMNVASDGSFTAITEGCSISGTFAPRASGKNVFNFSMTFGGSPCIFPNQSATGIAIEYTLVTGMRQLLIAGTNSSQTAGSAFFGTR